jgi:hypothetical protein
VRISEASPSTAVLPAPMVPVMIRREFMCNSV